MLRSFLGVSCALVIASGAMAGPPLTKSEVKPVQYHGVGVGPDIVQDFYSNIDTLNGAWFWGAAAGAVGGPEGTEYGDDLHFGPTADDLQECEIWYQNNDSPDPNATDNCTLRWYENDDANTLWPESGTSAQSTAPLIDFVYAEDLPVHSDFSWLSTITLTTPMPLTSSPDDCWFTCQWDSTETGPIVMNDTGPEIGTSEPNFWWAGDPNQSAGEGLYTVGGFGNLGMRMNGESSGGGPACLGLDVPLLVAGSPATITVTGDPGRTVAVLYSIRQGSFQLSRAGWCLDLGLQLPPDPRGQVIGQGVIQGLGTFSFTIPIPGAASGRTVYFQAAARGTCPDVCQSEVVERIIP